jgi:hypothetical protein
MVFLWLGREDGGLGAKEETTRSEENTIKTNEYVYKQ